MTVAAPSGATASRPGWTSADARPRLLVLGLAIVVGVLAELSLANAGADAEAILTDAASGFAFVATGFVAWQRRPASRVGPIMIGIGLAWFGGDFLFAPVPLVGPLSLAAQATARILFAWLLLAFPSGRLQSELHRWAVGLIAALAVGLALLQLVTFAIDDLCPCPPNPFAVAAGTELAGHVATVSSLVGIGMTIVLVPLVIRRAVLASGPARRALLPVLGGGAFSLLGVLPVLITDLTGIAVEPISWLPIVWIALPIGFLVALLQLRMARGAIADLVIRLGETPAPEHLRDALATALRDPSLELVRWSEGQRSYVDAAGQPTSLPVAGSDRAVTLLEGERGRIAAILHDPALADDPGLVTSVGTAVRLAVENERLTEEVRAQLAEVQASRARIVEAGDTERRRIERNLHDGAQQRLVALSLALRRARTELPVDAAPDALATLDQAADQLREALSELRSLARGIHPAILTEAGLAAALRALGRDAPLPVDVRVDIETPLPEPVEAAAYFVAAEALTNAVKHADAARIELIASRENGVLTIGVLDDGRGGAALTGGTGLRGLADRVAALGGELEVASPNGGGTRVTARIPIAVGGLVERNA